MKVATYRILALGLSVILISPGLGLAQSAGEKFSLSGPDQRDWIFNSEAPQIRLSDGSCEAGHTWTFHVGGSLIKSRCVNKRWQRTEARWKMSLDGNEGVITIDGVRYAARMFRKTILPGEPPVLIVDMETERKDIATPVKVIRLTYSPE